MAHYKMIISGLVTVISGMIFVNLPAWALKLLPVELLFLLWLIIFFIFVYTLFDGG